MAAQEEKYLVVFDFDHSLVDANTDTWVTKLGDVALHKLQAEWEGCWTDLMDVILSTLHKSGVSEDQLLQHMVSIPFDEDMKSSCRLLSSHKSVEAVILSDSNSWFINSILTHTGLDDVFTEIVTNPADMHADGRLSVKRFHGHTCYVCPPNLCKGSVLEGMMKRVQPTKVVYIGDGGGDVCPSLKLRPQDTLLAREGYKLSKHLKKWPRSQSDCDEKKKEPFIAELIHWSAGRDVLKYFQTLL